MCGIAGWYRRAGRPVARETIVSQCDRIVHRGPDDSGDLVDGDFGFGMRRLSIIDVAGGHQPIASDDGRYAVVFNGEIYNHLELRAELAKAGFAFRTKSDTETLLLSFVHWGEDAWLRLEGMYAAAIWDRAGRFLTLARDPLGIKPLYLTEQNGGLAFASELRALRVLPEHRFDIDERAVHDFWSFGHVQKPRSIYRQVRGLEPGNVLRIGPTGAATRRVFWQPRFRIREGVSEQDWIEETRARVLATVRRHMLADVPVGAFLSGGVDSGAVTAAMARSTERRIKAFTIGFPGSAIDETESARRFALHLGCEHVVLPMQPMAAQEIFPAVQRSFDEPCAATAAVPIWYLSRLAAQHVKVVLCGEGGDEIFAGYKRQRTAELMQRWSPLIRAMGPAARLIDRLPRSSSRSWNYLHQNAMRFRDAALLSSGFQRFFAGTQITSPALRARIYDPGFFRRQEGPDAYAKLEAEYFGDPAYRSLAPLQQFLLADLTVHMPGSLLNRLDRASMAHSLEARVPFLSHQFVDWSLTIPLEMKLKGKVGKYVLRKAAEPWLPAGAMDKRKLGFQLPFAEWFRGDFSDFAREAWHASGAADSGYLVASEVDAIAREHRAGKANHGRILYAIIMWSCWWQDQKRPPQREAEAGGCPVVAGAGSPRC
jgi:asparagine synthase (glutamine-hydrolysing)